MPTKQTPRRPSRGAAKQRNWRARASTYPDGRTTVDAKLAEARIAQLRKRYTLDGIAAMSGLQLSVVRRIANGQRKRVHRTTMDRLNTLGGVPQPHSRVDALVTKRLVQALLAEGWCGDELDRRRGLPRQCATLRLLQAKRVFQRTEDEIRALARVLSWEKPPQNTWRQRAAATSARQWAAREGWAPLVSWDLDDIGNPQRNPKGVAA